jgi:ribonucleoside-diphosphate reductase alpha chain
MDIREDILKKRYYLKNEEDVPVEDWDGLCKRVAKALSENEEQYEKFYNVIHQCLFLPNTPALINAGREKFSLSACYVIPVEDSMEGIYDAVKHTALIHKSGGGTGFSFSRLRPAGDIVATTKGVASGPCSFIRVFDTATEVTKQGGCLVPETMVTTAVGILKLSELVNQNAEGWQKHEVLVYTDAGWKVSLEGYNNGTAKVRKIRLSSGVELVGTLNHKVKVWDVVSQSEQWRELGEIKLSDLLKVVLGGYKGSNVLLNTKKCVSNHNWLKPAELLETLTPELGWLLGYIYGNGFVAKDGTYRLGATIPDKKPEILKTFHDLTKKIFGVTPILNRKNDEAASTVVISSKYIWEFFYNNGFNKEKATEIEVPLLIRTSPEEVVAAFIRGYFDADGSLSDGYPVITSVSKQFLSTIQTILFSLGIPSVFGRCSENSSRLGNNTVYRLTVRPAVAMQRFNKIIKWKPSILSGRKNGDPQNERYWQVPEVQHVLESTLTEIKEKYGYGVYRAFYRTMQHYLPYMKQSRRFTYGAFTRIMKHYGEIVPASLKIIFEKAGKTFWDEVVEITDLLEDRLTLDLSVNENHTYIANGIVTHNTRRGANMGILRVDHPDIMEFINLKKEEGRISNFNLSIGITDDFMSALKEDKEFNLVFKEETRKTVKAKEIWNAIVEGAWRNGEPGVVFLDTINRFNATPNIGEIEATNPCGEQPLLPFEACVLGSINLSEMISNGEIDWKKLDHVVRVAVRFLDNVIDVQYYPVPEIEKMHKGNRKIGLGVMGWADMLIKMRIPYNSDEALSLAEEIMGFITDTSIDESESLAEEKGVFPNWEGSVWHKKGIKVRNATTTTIAPTGSISIIAGCSSGIEPVFDFVTIQKRPVGEHKVVHPLYEEWVKNNGDKSLPEYFVTARDIPYEWHLKMQAAFQKYTHNAVSKTINLPNSASKEDISKAFLMAYKLGLKGITVYRDGSRQEQVISSASEGKTFSGKTQNVLDAKRICVDTSEGKVYINVSLSPEKDPLEVFITSPVESKHYEIYESFARIFSVALRNGVPVKKLLSQLEKANQKYGSVSSIPSAIIRAFRMIGINSHEESCPDCGGILVLEEGCVKCLTCGYTKC